MTLKTVGSVCISFYDMLGGSGVMFILGLIAASIVSFPSLACGNQVLSSTFLLLYGGLTLVINSKFYLIFVGEHVLITQLCLTLCNPMNGSPPGSSVHGILQARRRVGCHALLQGIFLTHGSNPHLLCFLHWQVRSLALAPPGKTGYPYELYPY